MRKRTIIADTISLPARSQEEWLDLEQIASVEVTSEDSNFPIESALTVSDRPAASRERG
jgi:hypothetical protein